MFGVPEAPGKAIGKAIRKLSESGYVARLGCPALVQGSCPFAKVARIASALMRASFRGTSLAEPRPASRCLPLSLYMKTQRRAPLPDTDRYRFPPSAYLPGSLTDLTKRSVRLLPVRVMKLVPVLVRALVAAAA